MPNNYFNELTSAEEIKRITRGEAYRIRGAEELSPTDVLKVMKNQLRPYSTQEIEGIVNTFPEEDRELALKTLQKMSQYGNLQSLKNFADSLSAISELTDSKILTDKATNIATSLQYLQKKGSLPEFSQGDKTFIQYLRYNSILVLDEDLLKRLEADRELVDTIKSLKNVDIVYPEGWINGNNPFNHSSVQEIRQRTAVILEDAKRIKHDTDYSDSRAVNEALNAPVLERIKELGLTDNLKIVRNSSRVVSPDAEHVAELLAPLQIPEKVMLEQLEKIPQSYRQAALELLSRESRVFSTRTLNEVAKKQQQKILKLAKQKGILPKNIYYYVPEYNKSYVMVTMQHQIANSIPGGKIITQLNDVNEFENSMVVILDDVAGSGMSLKDNYHTVKQNYKGNIVVAPTISTNKAEDLFKSFARTDNKLTYLPGEIITSFRDNPYFGTLPDNQKILVEKVMGHKGFDNNGLNIAFPYMSPDNNNSMFATLFAPNLLLGGKPAAKNYGWQILDDFFNSVSTAIPPTVKHHNKSFKPALMKTNEDGDSFISTIFKPNTGFPLNNFIATASLSPLDEKIVNKGSALTALELKISPKGLADPLVSSGKAIVIGSVDDVKIKVFTDNYKLPKEIIMQNIKDSFKNYDI